MDFTKRISRFSRWLEAEGASAALLVDVEGRRDVNIRYLTGQPGDAVLFVLANGRTVLIPWDINLARTVASADTILAYGDFERSLTVAAKAVVEREGIEGRIEVSAATPYPVVEELRTVCTPCEIVCRQSGMDELLSGHRMVKDGDELRLIERAAEVTNELLTLLEMFLTHENNPTEVDVALFLESEARKRGCEGMSFESLIAGPQRSFGIHAFPAYSSAPFGGPGLSIADFGVLVEGYPSDVTVTVARGKLSQRQEEMLDLVQRAYDRAVAAAKPGATSRAVAAAVDELFASAGYSMPHSLGHGLGLLVHEQPYLRDKAQGEGRLESGMVFTIEPGLYDPELGGVRLENDFVVTETGTDVLTSARILRFS